MLIHTVACLPQIYFLQNSCKIQPNGDGSKVTPSLKGLADVTVVNIPCSLTNKVNCKKTWDVCNITRLLSLFSVISLGSTLVNIFCPFCQCGASINWLSLNALYIGWSLLETHISLFTLVSKGCTPNCFLLVFDVNIYISFSGPDPHLCGLLQKSEWPRRPVLQCQSNDRGSQWLINWLITMQGSWWLIDYNASPMIEVDNAIFALLIVAFFSCSTEKRRERRSPSITPTIQS